MTGDRAAMGLAMVRVAAYLWTLPNSLLGMLIAVPNLLLGGRIRIVSGVLEVHGPLVRLLLRRAVPLAGGATALTIGHVVLGVSEAALEVTRAHERIHVAQYERWGPLFIPAYFLCSFLAAARGGRPYRDNRFEREAYGGEEPPRQGDVES
jgi:hypothetical protein